jgi:hypothetical protein
MYMSITNHACTRILTPKLLHCGVIVCAQQLEKRGHRRPVHSASSFSTDATEPNTPSSSSGSVDDFLGTDITVKSSNMQN